MEKGETPPLYGKFHKKNVFFIESFPKQSFFFDDYIVHSQTLSRFKTHPLSHKKTVFYDWHEADKNISACFSRLYDQRLRFMSYKFQPTIVLWIYYADNEYYSTTFVTCCKDYLHKTRECPHGVGLNLELQISQTPKSKIPEKNKWRRSYVCLSVYYCLYWNKSNVVIVCQK